MEFLGLQSAKIQCVCLSIVFIILYIKRWVTTPSASQDTVAIKGLTMGDSYPYIEVLRADSKKRDIPSQD